MFASIKNRSSIIFKTGLILCFGYFFWLMLQLTLEYIPAKSDVSFLMIKQTEVLSHPEYLSFFYIHVYSSILVLLTGFLAIIRVNFKKIKLHQYAGKAYVFVILVLAAPTGTYMGFFANGGLFSKISFVLLGIFWWLSTFKAYQLIRQKNYKAHQHWMWRSYALTISAITLRLWKWVIVYFFHPSPMDVYQIVAWLGWIPNIILIELLIRKKTK